MYNAFLSWHYTMNTANFLYIPFQKKTKQQISLFRLSAVLFLKKKNFFIPAVYKYPFANNPIIAVDSCGQCPNIPVYSLL